MNIFGHATYIGNSGYNSHCKNFFRNLNKYCGLRVRNFTVGPNWNGIEDGLKCHGKDVTEEDKNFICLQTLWNPDRKLNDFPIFKKDHATFDYDINLVLAEANHYYFYDPYEGPKVGYTVWETTKYFEPFFEKLKEYDQIWVPSKWQAEVTVNQGADANKVKVVPEGVDSSVFFPENYKIAGGKFRFLIFGRWDNRKSTVEIIRAFKNTFGNTKNIELIISVEDPYNQDGLGSTKNRLKHYDLECDNISILNFPKKEDYVKFLKSGHVFLSCSRSEGWNLPLIEAMACGTPSIYSDCSGQLEYAKGKGIPIKIKGEIPAQTFYKPEQICEGNWYEPDFKDLEEKIVEVYNNYEYYKNKAVEESKEIRDKFSWDNSAKLAIKFLEEIKIKQPIKKKVKHIVNESPSIGDIIAWVPMVDKYQKKHDCIVNLYTPHWELFKESYPNINFHDYNSQPRGIEDVIRIATYDVGEKKWSEFNLQELAAVLLGIEYEPTVPKITKPKNPRRPLMNKYVCIATQSTAQFKYWNNPSGWDQTIDYLNSLGYDVICIDKSSSFGIDGSMNYAPKNAINGTGAKPFSERIAEIMYCDFFIGLTSGLSWLAWGLGKPVVFISGISLPKTDFYTPYRVTNTDPNLCHGCASEPGFVFDKHDWLFCPKKKNFECTKQISFEMVKEKIDQLIKDHNL